MFNSVNNLFSLPKKCAESLLLRDLFCSFLAFDNTFQTSFLPLFINGRDHSIICVKVNLSKY